MIHMFKKMIPYVIAGALLMSAPSYSQDRKSQYKHQMKAEFVQTEDGYMRFFSQRKTDQPQMVEYTNIKVGKIKDTKRYMMAHKKWKKLMKAFTDKDLYQKFKNQQKEDTDKTTIYPFKPMPPPIPKNIDFPIIIMHGSVYKGDNVEDLTMKSVTYLRFDPREEITLDIVLEDKNKDGTPDLGELLIKKEGNLIEMIKLDEKLIYLRDDFPLRGTYGQDNQKILQEVKETLDDAVKRYDKMNNVLEDYNSEKLLKREMFKDLDDKFGPKNGFDRPSRGKYKHGKH